MARRQSSRRGGGAPDKKDNAAEGGGEGTNNVGGVTAEDSGARDTTSSSPTAQIMAASMLNAPNSNNKQPSEESLVLSYLRRYGLADAASELQSILEKDKAEQQQQQASKKSDGKKRKRSDSNEATINNQTNKDNNSKLPPIDYDVSEDAMEYEDTSTTTPSGALLKAATGGGFGYDLDAAPSIALWGVGSAPPSLRNRMVTELILEGREMDMNNINEESSKIDETNAITEKDGDVAMGDDDAEKVKKGEKETKSISKKDKEEIESMVNFRDEARRYIEGFTSLITWILTLPDDPANPIVTSMTRGRPPFSSPGDQTKGPMGGENQSKTEEDRKGKDNEKDGKSSHKPHEGLANLVKHSLAAVEHFDPAKPKPPAPHTLTLPLGATAVIPSESSIHHDPLLLPPSCKPELLALSFPLLVHTYCELLSCGLEHTAVALLDTYRHLYDANHHNEIADLDKCQTTARIVEVNEDVLAQSVLHSDVRLLTAQISVIAKRLGEVQRESAALKRKTKRTAEEEKLLQEHTKRIQRYTETYARSHEKVRDLSTKNDILTKKLATLPFLRRSRALKWNVTISTAAFAALSGFVSSTDELLPMSALLQSRCHLIVERRDPLPFCPPSILEDIDGRKENDDDLDDNKVRWAAPIHPVARAIEAGEDVASSGVSGSEPQHKLARSILTHSEALPYPKFKFEDGEDSKDAESRASVEFNRALLVNGFRRLEALELKQEYESGLLPSSSANEGSKRQMHVADALQPSVLLATLCSSSSKPSNEADAGAGPSAAPWSEPNIGIVSASICPPDGRKVAVGCDDAAVRIWSLDKSSKSTQHDPSSSSSLGDSSLVLLGHKNGFPVFDVDWTRDGRTLLSAGGDGTVRLWDTHAVGPYGKLSSVAVQTHQKDNPHHTVGGPASTSLSTVVVPGAKAESLVEVGGAALSVYRGHAPSTPVWSVSSAPCGYYFASAGSDYTARIWTTDRTSPVRILSGHVSPTVNCVAWHPNCNYVITASDDKTCRLFDIQTGRCVRLLSGSARGLNLVRVSPSGRYAAGSGYDGVVRIWDLGNGRLMNELRPSTDASTQASSYSEGLINAMTFSACGSALAVSGEDSTVRIWDVRGAGNHLSNPDYFAATREDTATSSFSDGLSGVVTKSQLERMPKNERLRPGTREPTKVFKTNHVSIRDLKFTKRNLLLAVGDY